MIKTKILQNYFIIIVIAAFLNMIITGGIANNLSLYTLPVSGTLGISRGSFALAMSLRSIISVITTFVSGFLFAKFGSRKVIPLSLIIGMIGLFILSKSKTLLYLYIGSGILGLADGICITTAAVYVVSRWFHKHYGLVLGIVTAATGLGGGIFSVVLSNIIYSSSWQSSYLFSAMLYGILGIILFIFLRDKPQDIGLAPYGEGQFEKRGKNNEDNWEGYTMPELKKKPTFYILLALTFLSCTCAYMISNIIIPYFQDKGFSVTKAASVNSVYLLSLAAAKFSLGFLRDKIGAKNVTYLSLCAAVVSIFLFSQVSDLFAAYGVAVIFSLAMTLAGIIPPLLIPRFFGHRIGATGIGIILSSISAASIFGSTISNMLYDVLGSYTPVFYGVSVMFIVIIALYAILFFLADRDRKRATPAQVDNLE